MIKKKKLLLTYPNQRWQEVDPNTSWNLNPTTLCLLAKMVEDDVDVKIIDAQFYNISLESFLEEVKNYSPDYVGISILCSDYEETLNITAENIKKILPNTIIIAGGIHPTIEYKIVIQNKNIDYVIRGEGEYAQRDLIRFLNKTGDFPDEGVVYKKDGKLIVLPQARVQDLTKIPWADYSLIKFEDYLNRGTRFGPYRPPEFPCFTFSVTRGCPFNCCFCQVSDIAGKKVRTRDPEDVLNQILFLKEKYGIKSILFEDDNIMAVKPFFKRLLQLFIEKQITVKLTFMNFAVFLLTDEILDLLTKVGCTGLNIAVDSGNKRVLKEIINKPVDLDRVPETIKKIKTRGLYCLVNFIIGFPGESWEEIRETIRYAENCGADYVRFFIAVPLHNTRLWDIAQSQNLLLDPDNKKVEWGRTRIISNEWTSNDLNILRAYEWDRINFSPPEKLQRVAKLWALSIEEMNEIRKKTRDSIQLDNKKHDCVQ